MRNYLSLLITIFLLAACGGGSGGGAAGAGSGSCPTCSTGSTVPVGSVSGTSFDGLIINGTASVYDFTTGAKGALLGSAQTDGNGLYSLSLQVETRPVLIEVKGGYYVEEAGTIPANVSLSTNHKLTAVANYTTGATLAVAVTTYSHLAAGLAAYEIKNGTAVATAISNANTRVSSLVGVDILTTTPKEITDPANASASLTPPLRYGFLAGAISDWTYTHAPAAAVPHQTPYTSIDFAQLLYDDIAADGLLDGVGTGGASLSFGTTPLSVAVYRLAIGTSIVRIAANANNKTGLDATKVMSFAQAYIANTDAFFNAVPVVAFAPQAVTVSSPTTGTWMRKTININASASSPFGLQAAELLVDGVSVATSANLAAPSFSVDSTTLTDGPHTFTVRSTDVAGVVTTASATPKVDNTGPTALACSNQFNGQPISYTVTDTGSGLASADAYVNTSTVYGTTSITASNTWAFVTTIGSVNVGTPWSLKLTDAAGNCTTYSGTMTIWGFCAANSAPTLANVTLNACP